jgi:transcriptional regulator with XRE-family HTH domain
MKTTTNTRKPNPRGRLDDGRPNPIDSHVGARMKLRRTLLGLSQEQLAGMIGLTFQQVQKYERGANRIGASRLFDLSRALDVPLSFFFDDMPPEVAASSPAAVLTGTSSGGVPVEVDPACRRETLEIARELAALPLAARAGIRSVIRAALAVTGGTAETAPPQAAE